MNTTRTLFHKIFISEDEYRLRAGWRLLLHALLYLLFSGLFGVAWGILAVVFDLKLPILIIEETLRSDNFVLIAFEVIVLTCATWAARRFLDRRPFHELGIKLGRSGWNDFIVGILISALLFSMIYITFSIMGWSLFQSWAWESENFLHVIGNTAVMFLVFLGVAYREELLSRGYHLQNLEQGTNLPFAVILSSLIFSILHLTNPNGSWMAFTGLLAAGFFLAYGYIRTQSLWLPIGLHLGWNFFEGTIFGFPVSGIKNFSLIQQQISGPDLITGGAFGPEAGLILFPTLLIGAYLIKVYSQK